MRVLPLNWKTHIHTFPEDVIDVGPNGDTGEPGDPGPPGLSISDSGVVYVAWGQTECPSTAETELLLQCLTAAARLFHIMLKELPIMLFSNAVTSEVALVSPSVRMRV